MLLQEILGHVLVQNVQAVVDGVLLVLPVLPEMVDLANESVYFRLRLLDIPYILDQLLLDVEELFQGANDLFLSLLLL